VTDNRRRWTTAQLAPLAICPDCDADVTVTEAEPGLFTGMVEHDGSCPWYRAFVRSGVVQFRLYRKDQPTTPRGGPLSAHLQQPRLA
jgi:hypothetical protein